MGDETSLIPPVYNDDDDNDHDEHGNVDSRPDTHPIPRPTDNTEHGSGDRHKAVDAGEQLPSKPVDANKDPRFGPTFPWIPRHGTDNHVINHDPDHPVNASHMDLQGRDDTGREDGDGYHADVEDGPTRLVHQSAFLGRIPSQIPMVMAARHAQMQFLNDRAALEPG